MYTFNDDHKYNFRILARHQTSMTAKEKEFFGKIFSWCQETGKVSYKQLVVVGRLYKKYVQRGQYVEHNWRIWR